MSTPISVVGTIATDPKFFNTQTGSPLCSFRLASSERRFDRETQEWIDGETNWFGVTAFRGLAEHASRSVRKGDRVVVQGRLRIRSWESGEKKGTSVDIEADALGHDLRWGVSTFIKTVGADAAAKTGANTDSWSSGSPSVSGDSDASHDDTDEHVTVGVPDKLEENAASGTAGSETMSGDGFIPAAA